ncbi:MAG: hypothetical protein ACYC2H_09670 [Thermoplasmatota archaeon]
MQNRRAKRAGRRPGAAACNLAGPSVQPAARAHDDDGGRMLNAARGTERSLALLLAAVVLVPVAAASESSEPFTLGPGDSVTLKLKLDAAATVGFALNPDVASVRDLTVDGPGACDMETTSTTVGQGATVAMVRCQLSAGTHTFTVHLVAGFAHGSVSASKGHWA